MFCLLTGDTRAQLAIERNSISVVQCDPLHAAKPSEGVMFFGNNYLTRHPHHTCCANPI